ncbi:hypothetical protein [Pseudoalteromonas prydzensis]|uniref:hypothetical protein n=1 Tax=Pseudoalteromonas prydzensis TaxID=182141 RepID=UPI003FD28501
MTFNSINVTRWINEAQKFVEVGTLFRDDSLKRMAPLIGFNYHPDYVAAYPRLLPVVAENTKGLTLLPANNNKGLVPSYFKQFLPSERNKSLLNKISDDFYKLDQYQQIEYLTKFRGVFGAVQLNYDQTQQKNKLPDMAAAINLLDKIDSGNVGNLTNNDLSAMYHPNSDYHVVSTYLELDGNHVYCTLQKHATERAANEVLFIQNLMNECGIESAIAVKLEPGDGSFYVGQVTGEQIINKERCVSLMYNTVPIAAIISDAYQASNYENINFMDINESAQKVVSDLGAEIYKRALFTQLLGQKDVSAQNLKFRESGGIWNIAPQEIFNINHDPNTPFKMAFSDTISAYSTIKVNNTLIDMVVDKYKLARELVESSTRDVANGLSKLSEIAFDSGLTRQDAIELSEFIKRTGLLDYCDNDLDLNNSTDNQPVI